MNSLSKIGEDKGEDVGKFEKKTKGRVAEVDCKTGKTGNTA